MKRELERLKAINQAKIIEVSKAKGIKLVAKEGTMIDDQKTKEATTVQAESQQARSNLQVEITPRNRSPLVKGKKSVKLLEKVERKKSQSRETTPMRKRRKKSFQEAQKLLKYEPIEKVTLAR